VTEEEPSGSGSGSSVDDAQRRLAVLSFRAFHDAHSRPWHEFAHLELGRRDLAEDAVRAAFWELEYSWPRVLESASVDAHAWALLKEHVARRRESGRTALVETAAFALTLGRSVLEELGELEHSIGLFAAIARLPERQYDAIMLRYVLGFPDATVAYLMGVPQTTVRSTVRWARRRLARELGLEYTEPEGG
jgi:RNA polymerase sigma factor (sigma-70 family)